MEQVTFDFDEIMDTSPIEDIPVPEPDEVDNCRGTYEAELLRLPGTMGRRLKESTQ